MINVPIEVTEVNYGPPHGLPDQRCEIRLERMPATTVEEAQERAKILPDLYVWMIVDDPDLRAQLCAGRKFTLLLIPSE